jgi:hypothetical protein
LSIKEEDGRRILQIGNEVIGLPNREVFTKGIRLKILEPLGTEEPKVVLDEDLMEPMLSPNVL